MFRQPYTQILSMATNGMQEGESEANPDINETCCAYNLLKLTKDLNCYNPDDAKYMDSYERTLYNQVIGSLNPDKYETCYQYAVGLNATKPFGNETPQSTCCGGTGSENHTKYQPGCLLRQCQHPVGGTLYAHHAPLEGEGRYHQAGLSLPHSTLPSRLRKARATSR